MAPYGHELLCYLLLTIQYWCMSHTTNAQPVNGSATHVLADKLISSYPKRGKIVVPRWGSEPVDLTMMLTIQHVINVDMDKQSVSFRSEDLYEWRDEFLTWDPAEYQGLTNIPLPVETVWTPDISIVEVLKQKCTRSNSVMVDYKGKVTIVPSCINEIRCHIDITYFPFDKQTCTYYMSSWPLDNKTLVISENPKIVVYRGNFDWEILNIKTNLHNSEVHWFTEQGLTYPMVTITFVIHHRTPLFAFLLVLPAVLLSVLTSVVFLLPSYNESKIEIGLSIFLSFMVLLNILMDATPGSSSGVPLIAYYFTVNSLLIAMSVFCATVVLRVHNKSTSHNNMSARLKTLTLFMARTFRMTIGRESSDRKATPKTCPTYNDWVLLASVLDRFFFIIYIIINVTATLTVFFKYREDKHIWE